MNGPQQINMFDYFHKHDLEEGHRKYESEIRDSPYAECCEVYNKGN